VSTATQLLVEEECEALRQNAILLGWTFTQLDPQTFTLAMQAKDQSWFYLWVDCEGYGAIPPAWHWHNPVTNERGQLKDIPKGGGFFHPNAVICAPWNRLAYQRVDARGPHGEWELANWRTNKDTGACRMISAMALRIFAELWADSFSGRMG
jgi:hypothetical protein